MNLQPVRTFSLAAASSLIFANLNYAQVHRTAHKRRHVEIAIHSNSASHVAAEMTKGKLNTTESQPGDIVIVKLQDDVKSNGALVLKKGTTITGIVRNVKRTEAKGQVQSILEIVWLAPASQTKTPRNLSFALESVTQVNPNSKHEKESADDFGFASAVAAHPAVRSSGAVNPIAGLTSNVTTTTVATVETVTSTSPTGASLPSNPALLNMPSVMPVDHQTSSAIENTLGTDSSSQLFKVGHGRLVTAGGSRQSVDIFSHLNNDTVITSTSKDFEISSGAQMQLLVGVKK